MPEAKWPSKIAIMRSNPYNGKCDDFSYLLSNLWSVCRAPMPPARYDPPLVCMDSDQSSDFVWIRFVERSGHERATLSPAVADAVVALV